jgi:hypothetical protein
MTGEHKFPKLSTFLMVVVPTVFVATIVINIVTRRVPALANIQAGF